MADAQVPSRRQDVFGTGEFLSEIYLEVQRFGGATHKAIEEGKLGEEISLGRESTESIRLSTESIHHSAHSPSL